MTDPNAPATQAELNALREEVRNLRSEHKSLETRSDKADATSELRRLAKDGWKAAQNYPDDSNEHVAHFEKIKPDVIAEAWEEQVNGNKVPPDLMRKVTNNLLSEEEGLNQLRKNPLVVSRNRVSSGFAGLLKWAKANKFEAFLGTATIALVTLIVFKMLGLLG